MFKIGAGKFNVKEQGVTVGFDSLLQWIYPVGLVVTFEGGGV